jgi:adenine-specific DNA-methyltransferase
MPILNWIGKDAVVNHDKDVPFRLLKNIKSKSVGDSENLIIEGDNLEALKALLPRFTNKIKCIYIDPPYNTGKAFTYGDNRGNEWVDMMRPRLEIAHRLLSNTGAIVVHIDEHEVARLTMLLDDIFGRDNRLGTIVWDKGNPKGDANAIAVQHESIVAFAKRSVAMLGMIKYLNMMATIRRSMCRKQILFLLFATAVNTGGRPKS